MTLTAVETHAATGLTERELLAQLGLGAGASNAEIEEAHDEVVAFLEGATGAARSWARRRISEVDEAYALLRGEHAADGAMAPNTTAVVVTPNVVRERPRRPAPAKPSDEDRDWLDEMNGEPPERTRRARRDRQRAAAASARRTATMPSSTAGRRRLMVRGLIGGAAIAGIAVVGLAVYSFGAPAVPPITGTPNPSSATTGVDQTKVAADMQKLAANANDLATLQDLADLYYAGGDYATAKTWLDKVLAIDPKNVAALLGTGAADYNLNDLTGAETAWLAVVAIDPKNVEAHYDLGFMYLSEGKNDKVTEEWNKVIALAPDSDVAKTVATHLAALNGSPAPSGAGSGSPAPSTAPQSPAPSAQPSPS